MRRPHYLKPSTSHDYPQQCIWFDTETSLRMTSGEMISLAEWKRTRLDTENPKCDNKEVTQHLNFGWACYMRCHRDDKWTDEDWLRFTSRNEFWRWCESKSRRKSKLYLFCHNTAFDLPVLDIFHELPQRGWTLRKAIIDAPPTVLQFTRGGSTIVVLDTLNIWRLSLKYLGEKIGLPKLDMPDNNDVSGEWDTYARQDVEIIRKACLDWFAYLREMDWGAFAPTLASQAMTVFRHKYMTHDIFIDCNERALKLTRGGYYGGRVECFRIGKFTGEFYSLDVNRMYPSVMRDNDYPVKLIGHTAYANIRDLAEWVASKAVCARVICNVPEPCFPVRGKDKLIFPVGEFECILSTPELIYALDHGYLQDVKEVAIYDQAPIFHRMMTDMDKVMIHAKEIGDDVLYFHTKKLQNSLYGKCGQNGLKWREAVWTDDLTCKSWAELDYDTGTVTQCRQLGGLIQYKETNGESRDSFPAIAAHVTAYARMKLWRGVLRAGRENVYYCDTDCMWVNRMGLERMHAELHESSLGAWKVDKQADHIELYGAKDYRFGKIEKTKGVRKEAIWVDDWTIEQEQWSGLRGLIARDEADAPRVKKIQKTLARLYSKGIVDQLGFVQPYQLVRATIDGLLQSRFDVDDRP